MSVERIETMKCDGDRCGKKKDGDSNHWIVGVQQNGHIIVAVNRESLPVDYGKYEDSLVKDFCGEQCTIKWISKMLTEIKKEKK